MDQKLLLHLYDAVLEYIDTGVHAVDPAGKTIIYNRKMREIEGMELEDLLDKNIMDVFQFHDEESTLLKVLRTKEPECNKRQKYINIKGKEINTINDSHPVFYNGEIIGAIEIVKDVTRLEQVVQNRLQRDMQTGCAFSDLTGENPEFANAVHQAKKMAGTMLPVLIIGEAGTGKETFAHCMHHDSEVSGKPFFLLSCNSYESGQLEEIVFGTHGDRGILDDPGIGTIFFDELTAFSVPLQQRLLHIIRERNQLQDKTLPRLIFGTCLDPIDAAAGGKLLKNLYYELAGNAIFIPALKNRLEDVPLLASKFLKEYNELLGVSVQSISEGVFGLFSQYDWPGNVRELKYVIESAVRNADDAERLDINHMPSLFRKKTFEKAEELLIQRGRELKPFDDYMTEAEIYYLQKALNLHNHNITKTAESLKMSRQNLQYRIRKYGLLDKN
ncbi:sigma 54-interacting transcriptional regulator [Siminovitchia sp. 179-K 8D1 HS]|uniref:sigma 54-interacting transcriptional regulator n=1 Tax=Siminovitchia sp. 179-K 8D1 HS TaxID=3142385 RepID=UPI0039A17A3D